MKLTKDQKEQLKSLTNHPGWGVLELLVNDAEIKLGKALLSTDLSDKNNLDIIKKNQLFVEARQSFLESVKTNTRDIVNPIDSILC